MADFSAKQTSFFFLRFSGEREDERKARGKRGSRVPRSPEPVTFFTPDDVFILFSFSHL